MNLRLSRYGINGIKPISQECQTNLGELKL